MFPRRSTSWFLALALGAGSGLVAPSVAHAQTSNEQVAQLRFGRGRDLFNQSHFAEALPEFRAAVALVPSPNTRLYIARCLHELGRNAEGLIEYQHAAAEAADRANTEPRYAATRDVARTEAAALEPLVGHLTLHVPSPPEGLVITADGNPVPAQVLDVPAPFDPHAVSIVVRAPGHEPFQQTVTIEAGHDAELTVQLRRAPETIASSSPQPSSAPPTRVVTVRSGGTIRLAGIAVAGVGVLGGAIGTAVFGSMAQTRFAELQRTCTAPCPDQETRIAEGITDRTLANVSIGVGAALLVAGGVMILVGGPREVQHTVPATTALRVLPWGAPTPQGGLAGMSVAF